MTEEAKVSVNDAEAAREWIARSTVTIYTANRILNDRDREDLYNAVLNSYAVNEDLLCEVYGGKSL